MKHLTVQVDGPITRGEGGGGAYNRGGGGAYNRGGGGAYNRGGRGL